MTENQLYSMSTELFDTSSNSSNPLKYDLYSLGLTNGVGSTAATALFATFTNTSSSGVVGISSGNNSTNSIFTLSGAGSGSGNQNNTTNSSSHSSNNSRNNSISNNLSSSNVMLTNAITIPRSNNPNQSHNPYQDEQHHHPASSPIFLSHILQHQHLQQQQPNLQQQQQQQQMNAMMSSSTTNMQQQQQQQQQQQSAAILLSANSMSDYSDYALDTLDASSLSPTLLQDVSLSAAATQSLTSGQNSSTSVSSPFYSQDPSSPLSNNNGSVGSNGGNGVGGNGNNNNISISSNTDITGVVTFLNSNATADDVTSSLLYDSNVAPNSMWSDIGSAIVTTKNEPFSIEDDYIFQLDKSDVHSTGFGDLDGDNFLEDIANLEEFLPSSSSQDGTNSFHLLSPSLHTAAQTTTPSPGMGPPMELLQQQQQQQQQHLQHQQQFTQLQSMQTSTSSMSGGGGDSSSSNNNSNSIHIQQQQQQQQQNHQSSSSPYEIYHSTPNKMQQQQQQQQQQHNSTFSPGSQPSHSPLHMNSITPPPPHANRSQYQQSQVKSRNMQELLKKGFSISPDRNNSSSLLGHSVPGTHGILMTTNALSPSSGSSGFGSTNGSSNNTGGGAVISVNSARKQFYHSMASNDGNTVSRLSSSAPTHSGLEHIWMRREPRQHLLSTGSLAEAESFSSLSTASVLSPDGHDYSQDDDDDNSTDFNSDHYDDLSSDNGSDNEDDASTIHGRSNSISGSHLSSSKGKERFFWQYNVQAKGPKGKRLVFQSKLEDPHFLNEVTDPVFSPNCSVRGIKVYKHSGKARKGDGNDLTPNPRKLHNIGKELDRLSRTINDMTPVSELPFNVRPKSRKEKNKLASRACRLKKKAQHEANKIKLYGLEIEHKRFINAISDIKQNLTLKYRKQNAGENSEDVDQQIERIYKHAIGGLAIAGGSTDFVNKVLDKVRSGQYSGGLEELRNT